MEGGARERMVVIMPSLSKSQQSHYPLVSALIVGFELTLAKCMAHRIDAPSYVVCEEYAHKSPPEQACPSTDRKRDDQREHYPEQEGTADKDYKWVRDEVAAVHLRVGIAFVEEPSKVRMEKPFERTMWISGAIRLRMMLDMGRSPFKCRSLE